MHDYDACRRLTSGQVRWQCLARACRHVCLDSKACFSHKPNTIGDASDSDDDSGAAGDAPFTAGTKQSGGDAAAAADAAAATVVAGAADAVLAVVVGVSASAPRGAAVLQAVLQ